MDEQIDSVVIMGPIQDPELILLEHPKVIIVDPFADIEVQPDLVYVME